MQSNIKNINENLMKLGRDIELIKNILLLEGELTGWARKELARARIEKEEKYVSLKEL